MRIKFDWASYEDVNEYAALIRAESPYMFLSEVKIEPNYPPKNRPYDPTTFDASFEVSSVEFLTHETYFSYDIYIFYRKYGLWPSACK